MCANIFKDFFNYKHVLIITQATKYSLLIKLIFHCCKPLCSFFHLFILLFMYLLQLYFCMVKREHIIEIHITQHAS